MSQKILALEGNHIFNLEQIKDTADEYQQKVIGLLKASPDKGRWKIRAIGNGDFSCLHFSQKDEDIDEKGWGIHVSLGCIEIDKLVYVLIPYALKTDSAFQIPLSLSDWKKINNGTPGVSQPGKVFTCYPKSPKETASLARELDALIGETIGPIVVSEKQVRKHGKVSVRFPSENRPSNNEILALKLFSHDIPFDLEAKPIRIATDRGIFIPYLKLMGTPAKSVSACYNEQDPSQEAILKIVQRGVGLTNTGIDDLDRARNEYEFLLSIEKAGLDFAPKPIVFKNMGTYALLLRSLIPGKTLSHATDRINFVPKIIKLLTQLHALGIVHRDLKFDNFLVTNNSRISLLDFELACKVGQKPISTGGTAGYSDPESMQADLNANTKWDIYSVSAMIFECLTGLNSWNLYEPRNTNFLKTINNKGPKKALLTLSNAMASDINLRPSLSDLQNVYNSIENAPPENPRGNNHQTPYIGKDSGAVTQTLNKYLNTVEREALQDGTGIYWQCGTKFGARYGETSLFSGSSGIILSLLEIAKITSAPKAHTLAMAAAETLLSVNPDKAKSGLFYGKSGVAIALAICGKAFNNKGMSVKAVELLSHDIASHAGKSFSEGTVGILYALLLLQDILDNDFTTKHFKSLASGVTFNASQSFDDYITDLVMFAVCLKKYSSRFPNTEYHSLANKIIDSVLNKLKADLINKKNKSNLASISFLHLPFRLLWATYQLKIPTTATYSIADILSSGNIFNGTDKSDCNTSFYYGTGGLLDTCIMMDLANKHTQVMINSILLSIDCLKFENNDNVKWKAFGSGASPHELFTGSSGTAAMLAHHLTGNRFPFLSPENINYLSQLPS